MVDPKEVVPGKTLYLMIPTLPPKYFKVEQFLVLYCLGTLGNREVARQFVLQDSEGKTILLQGLDPQDWGLECYGTLEEVQARIPQALQQIKDQLAQDILYLQNDENNLKGNLRNTRKILKARREELEDLTKALGEGQE